MAIHPIRRIEALRCGISDSPKRCIAYYSLVQAAYTCLAGSFELPMAIRLAGGPQYVAFVYAFYYSTLVGGFCVGSFIGKGGRASLVFRLELGLLACLNFSAVAFFPLISGVPALVVYFIVRGSAEGFYWSIRHPSFLWSVKDSGRDDFSLRLQSASVIVSVALPLASGAIVSFLDPSALKANPLLPPGYLWVFLITASVLSLALLASPRFEIGRRSISFKRIRSLGRLPESKSYRAYLAVTASSGVAVTLSAGVITFGVLKTEFRIGALNASIAFLSGIFFLLLRRALAGRKGARLGGVLSGAIADCLSRLLYSLAPGPIGLGLKTVLDSFAVPLKTLFGENVIRAHVERLSSLTGASVSELYIFQEYRLWLGRIASCAVVGAVFALAGAGRLPSGGPAVRVVLACAAPFAIAEFFLYRSFIREDS
jgi:hypothetical protein